MIRISRLSDYAIAILCEMSLKRNEVLSAKYLSERTRISESTVMKLLKLLTKGQLLVSSRGIKGGYMIDKQPYEISILDVVCAIDGPITMTLCSEDPGNTPCELEPTCIAKHGWRKINHALATTLAQFNLDDFIGSKQKRESLVSS